MGMDTEVWSTSNVPRSSYQLGFHEECKNFILAFNGEIYPSRILGFAVGIIVFGIMGWFLFREGVSPKTGVCLLLSLVIILIQVLWK